MKLNADGINKVFNDFLKNNGFECEAKIGTDFEYDYANSIIYYSLAITERQDRLFMDFIKRRGLTVDCGNLIASFFHELGHDQTLDLLEDREEEECREIKSKLTDKDEDVEIYFNLLDEVSATDWAVNYINSNLEKIQKLAIDLQPVVAEFFKENKVIA